jgi:hypothetical protein
MVIRTFSLIAICSAVVGCAAAPDVASESSEKVTSEFKALDVITFQECKETTGVGLAPMAAVRAHVPSNYTILGEPFSPVTSIAFRTADCEHIIVGGFDTGHHSIAQTGVSIVSPDGTGDRNQYQLWYYTDSPNLAVAMNHAGIPVEFTGKLTYDHTSAGPGVPAPINVFPGPNARPGWSLSGTVTPGAVEVSQAITINWWRETPFGSTKMASSGPGGIAQVTFGGGSYSVTTDANSALAAAYGSSTINFPLLQGFNTFHVGLVTTTSL